MNPVSALRRISYLLERNGADSYNVRAFRQAAAALEPVPEDELTRLAAAGRLQSMPGVGKSTAQAISEALAGDVPSYLSKLEADPAPVVLDPAAQARLDQLQ